jgi:hypothetical protein
MTSARRLSVLIAVIVPLLVLVAVLELREKQNDTGITAPAPITTAVQPAASSPAPPQEFPVAALRSALTVVCSNDAPDSDDKDPTQEEFKAYLNELNELKLNLSESSSAEHLHVAALLENDPALRVELLDRAISANSDDAFLLWSAVQICSESGESVDCPLRDWEQRLITVDGQNSESWIRVAANRYAAGEYDAALEAMRYASTAAESRAYLTEMTEMIERGFAAGSDYAFSERSFMALNIAASKLPRYGDYVTMCKEQSAKNVDFAYTCVAYGELVGHQGKTEMGVAIARTIQKLAHEALGEWENAAEIEQRLQARRQQRMDSIGDYNAVTERLIFSNPTLFYSYLAAVRSKGELEAQRYLAEEIERLLAQQPELACGPT